MNCENFKCLLVFRYFVFIGGCGMVCVLKCCVEGGFVGQLWLVNLQYVEFEGVFCVVSVVDLLCGLDVVFVVINCELIFDVVVVFVVKGVGGVICYVFGFVEIGEQGLVV